MTDAVVASEAAAGPSAGTMLRQAREAAGLHVAALAVALKVPVRKLEALEQDRFDELPDAVFVRALASSVCRTLKVDPQGILSRLPQSAVPRLVPERESINAPFRAPGDPVGPTWRDQLRRPPVALALLLVLGAGVLLAWPLIHPDKMDLASIAEPAAAPSIAPALVPAEPQVAAVPVAVPQPAGDTSSGTPAVPAADAQASPAQAPPTVQPAASAPAAAAAASADTAPLPAGVVAFRAKGPTWIRVADAKGVVTLQRLLAAGESAGASGALPLSVTVGSADVTEVLVRGKAFDLAGASRDNVARFEVK